MTAVVTRDIAAAAAQSHDLIVVGGGVYGAFVALESARRGLRPLLIERGDFGGGVSGASLRIVHGGLRYLQALDLRRCRESARERAWMLREFPDLVRPLACLMPLYGDGLRRPAAFRAALLLDRLATRGSRRDAAPPLPRGRTISPDGVAAAFPEVDRRGLLGGGVWHDGLMVCPERLLIEVLRWACAMGATVLNYVEATGLLTSGGNVAGVAARDREGGRDLELRSPVVVNAAGPWCRELARRFDRDIESLFRPSLAFNVLLDRPPPSDSAVAVAPRRPGGRMYFLVPCHGRLMAGTMHVASDEPSAAIPLDPAQSGPTPEQVAEFLADLNEAVPGWDLSSRDVAAVLSGRLPTQSPSPTEQAKRPVIIHHGDLPPGPAGPSPRGLWSISGVKYTTARLVAERAIGQIFPGRRLSDDQPGLARRPVRTAWPALLARAGLLQEPAEPARAELRRLIEEESALHLDDVILRRSAWGLDPAEAVEAGRRACALLGWDEARCQEELARLTTAVPAGDTPARRPLPPATAASGVGAELHQGEPQ